MTSAEFHFDSMPLTFFKVSEINSHLDPISKFPPKPYFKHIAVQLFDSCILSARWLFVLWLHLGSIPILVSQTPSLNCWTPLILAFNWLWPVESISRKLQVRKQQRTVAILGCGAGAILFPSCIATPIRQPHTQLQSSPSARTSASSLPLGASGLRTSSVC